MTTFANILDDSTSFLSATDIIGVGNWVAVANAAAPARTSKRAKTGASSLLITGTTNAATATVQSSDAAHAVQVSVTETYRAVLWFHHETIGRSVRVGVQFYDATRTAITQTTSHYTDVAQGFGEWTLATLIVTPPATAVYAALRVDLLNVNTATSDRYLWIDDAVIVNYGAFRSKFLDLASRWIPEWMLEADQAQTNPQFPMMRFLDLMGVQMDEILALIEGFDYKPLSDGGAIGDTSTLVDPVAYTAGAYPGQVAKPEWLPWLAQLLGVRTLSLGNTLGGTTWNFLETNYPTWAAWESSINAASTTPLTLTALTRNTTGAVSGTTSVPHGMAAGQVVTVAGVTPTSLNGYYEVLSASGSNFSYNQVYPILSIVRAATTVTVICGLPHNYIIGDVVTIAGTSFTALNGSFTVTGVSTTGGANNVFTYTTVTSGALTAYNGTTYPTNAATGTVFGTATPADLTWSFLETVGPSGLDPNVAVADFVRTGAAGIRAGTVEGMKRAARTLLAGMDIPANVARVGGTITVVTPKPHGLSVAGAVTIYDCAISGTNRAYTVASVIDSYTFTVASGGSDFSNQAAFVTNKVAGISTGFWNGLINTVTVTAGNNFSILFYDQIPRTVATGTCVISNSGSPTVNLTHTPVSMTVSADRFTLTFTSDQTVAPVSSAGGKARLAMDQLCYVVGTLVAQTASDTQVINFVNYARPAGGIITHEYTG